MGQPADYSRVIRDKDGRVARIVDVPEATDNERAIDEVATTVYCFRQGVLAPALRRLWPDNSLGEYYLSDTVGVLHDAGYAVSTVAAPDPVEALEVNDRAQLSDAAAHLRARINRRWMRRGVTMADPASTYLDATVRLEADVTLLPGVILEGRTTVATGAVLGPSVHLADCEVGARGGAEPRRRIARGHRRGMCRRSLRRAGEGDPARARREARAVLRTGGRSHGLSAGSSPALGSGPARLTELGWHAVRRAKGGQ